MDDRTLPPSLTALETRLAEAHDEVRGLTDELRSAYQRLERLQCHLRRSIAELERLEARGPARPGSGEPSKPAPGGHDVLRVCQLPNGHFGVYHHGALRSAFANFSDAIEEACRIAQDEDAARHGRWGTPRNAGLPPSRPGPK
ncbi:hypothetical protein LNKW23_18270 [Paralimibaculum aggregatum]|uniref:Uncharacterized protein n=1 Tax=Paralimibaculum aggregatum TaxID=3036245 RepID=A0ABQ6LK87_9RHOB|nr:hypothetical protein [Limibaculum sp. NKW23]GMG82614.1 hypothetical protein LNKW23_18270 [Limibaculum sp. NKW23]